ncbi:MAG TPA: SPFH domain-containing protein [Anaerolineales bacterium]|nr:SPFH domain-containing protein [Anaerolineales bacterium]
MSEILQNRWVWIVFSGLVLAAGLVWLYTLMPYPTAVNWFLDGLGFLVMYLLGLAVISQFVLPVQTLSDRFQVLWHFIGYGLGQQGPVVFVQNGKLVARKAELHDRESGVAVLDAASAIVLEHAEASKPGEPLVTAHGPGVVFIERGQRIVETLDLRRQSRGLPTRALTKDGIEVTANVSVTFGLSPEPRDVPPAVSEPLGRNRPARIFDAERCFKAVYGSALGEKQPIAWTDLPAQVAAEVFRDALSERTLDSLFYHSVNNPNHYPFADFQAQVQQRVRESTVLADRGILVFSAGVGNLTPPRAVLNQRIRAWRTRWQLAVETREAAVNSERMKLRGHWRARAQAQIINDLRLALAENPDQSKQALAMLLTRTLRVLSQDPATRKQLSQDVLSTLTQLQEWVK